MYLLSHALTSTAVLKSLLHLGYGWQMPASYLAELSKDAYMCQWITPSPFKVMSCRLFGTKPFCEQMNGNCWWDPWHMFINTNKKSIFIQLDEFENFVCRIAAIFVSTSACFIISCILLQSQQWQWSYRWFNFSCMKILKLSGRNVVVLDTVCEVWVRSKCYHHFMADDNKKQLLFMVLQINFGASVIRL